MIAKELPNALLQKSAQETEKKRDRKRRFAGLG